MIWLAFLAIPIVPIFFHQTGALCMIAIVRGNAFDLMEPNRDFHIVTSNQQGVRQESLSKPDPGATPFKVVIDPKLRLDLRRALIDLIDYHDEALAENFSQGKLVLDSYKEYIELFARSLKETMESREGVAYLLRSVGFEVRPEEINLQPELRWKKGPGVFGASLL